MLDIVTETHEILGAPVERERFLAMMKEGVLRKTHNERPISWPWVETDDGRVVRMPLSLRGSLPVQHALASGADLHWAYMPDAQIWWAWSYGPAGPLMDFALG